MALATRIFRVFVSSTFTDLIAERNALQEQVFPRLRELCAGYGARFQAIDLRWGISQEASRNQQTINICLGEIERCQQITPRPNFIALLGDRYGWCPPPPRIQADEFESMLTALKPKQGKKLLLWEEDGLELSDGVRMVQWDPHQDDYVGDKGWYRRDDNAVPAEYVLQPWDDYSYEEWGNIEKDLHAVLARGAQAADLDEEAQFKYWASATEQEIAAGVLHEKVAPEHVLCFLRSIEDPPTKFSAQAFLALVKARLEEKYPDGLSKSCRELVGAVLDSGPDASAKEFAGRIKKSINKISEETIEDEVLKFVQQALMDFTARDFLDLDEKEWTVDEAASEKQNDLKERLRKHLPEDNVHVYTARWEDSGITTDHIGSLPGDLEGCMPLLDDNYEPKTLCEAVWHSLARMILDEIKHPHETSPEEAVVPHIQPDDKLDEEALDHHKFAEERLRFFVGRTEILAKIADYLKNNRGEIFAIVGEGGSGKSALIAKSIEQTQRAHQKAEIVYRFIGVTPASSDGRSLLYSLCREISRRYGVDTADLPGNYHNLVPELGRRMQSASIQQPLIIFLDSLDQLSENQDARSLNWLPDKLPEYVSVIVSTREGEPFDAVKAKQARVEALTGLTREEGRDLLSKWLGSVQRTLQPDQSEEVLDRFECKEAPDSSNLSPGNPLYLKLAFEEARRWHSSSGKPHLEHGVSGIIEKNLIRRLAEKGNHGHVLVSHALGYLAASRYGLAEDELLDLLSRDLQVYTWFFTESFHLPADLIRWAIQYRRKRSIKQVKGNRGTRKDGERTALAWLGELHRPPKEEKQTAAKTVEDFLSKVLPNADGPRLPVVLWSRLYLDLATYLTERMIDDSPLLNFYHRELEEAASAAFLNNNKALACRINLADYFAGRNIMDRRRIQEEPWQLSRAGRWKELYALLSDLDFMKNLWEINRFEMLAYWSQVEANSLYRVGDGYRELLENPDTHTAYTVLSVMRLLNELGRPIETASLLEFLVNHYRQTDDLHNLQTTIGYLAAHLLGQGKLADALALFKEQENISRLTENLNELSSALGNQAVILQMWGQLEESMELSKEQERLCRQVQYLGGLASSLGNQALILQHWGRFEDALALHRQEERIYKELGDLNGLSRTFLNQARIFKSRGDFDSAMDLLDQGEEFCRQQGNLDSLQKTIGNKAEILINTGQLEEAMVLCKEQERICRQLGNTNDLPASLGNQGAIHLKWGNLDAALPLFQETARLCHELGNLRMLTVTLNNQAAILESQGRPREALDLFKEVEEICRQQGQVHELVMSLANQAITLHTHRMEGYESATRLLEEAYKLANTYGFEPLASQIRDVMKAFSHS